MLKKTITYEDLDGNPVTEDFYFNLSKAEIAEMELSYEGGWGAHLQNIIKSQDGAEIISTFKKILLSAIGRRSEDGRRFVKSPEIADEFVQTDAYSKLFMELVTDANAAAEFVKGIVPSDLAAGIAAGEKVPGIPEPAKDDTPAYIKENRDPTPAELQSMTKEELQEAFRRRNIKAAE